MEAETEDLSVRGLFIRTEALLPVGEETEIRLILPDGTLLGLRGRVAHMLTPSSARALGRHPGMGFELVGGDTTSRLKLRAHVDSLRTEITSPGLSTTTQAIVVEPSPPLRARMARCLEGAGFKVTRLCERDRSTRDLHGVAPRRDRRAPPQMDGMIGHRSRVRDGRARVAVRRAAGA